MSMRWCIPLLSCLLLAACSSGPRPQAGPTPSAPQAGTDGAAAPDAAACTAQGGSLRPLGRRGLLKCVIPFADAGKACSDKSQCHGDCLAVAPVPTGTAAQGVCQRDISENYGCRQTVQGGMGGSQICID
ncbi:hypothetical protein [Xanthomonas sp. SI]|uniref:hypothetical protein n=1 Tax=Xanthomonas sp. SI TaxID=2724123 RepID=UPI00163B1AAD|nr:hypothetical protein [Xanthomonas sp. SI]QNH10732.1 hypothetical protein HEP75_00135 [Xanthomonas sp. SI]